MTIHVETFWQVTLRRLRYTLAIVVSAVFFYALALVYTPPEYEGMSLLGWNYSATLTLFSVASLTVLLGLNILVSMLITHPDAPYTGLYCSFLGMAILPIHHGPIDMLLAKFQRSQLELSLYHLLRVETVIWTLILLIAFLIARILYARLFANIRWTHRFIHGEPSKTESIFRSLFPAWMFSPPPPPPPPPSPSSSSDASSPTPVPADPIPASQRWLHTLGALAIATAIAYFLLGIFVQSQATGQVLFGAYIAFTLAAAAGYYACSKTYGWFCLLAVPVTLLIGYYNARSGGEFVSPGHATSAIARGLPAAYIAAGIPGAIYGLHLAMKWRLGGHHHTPSMK